MSAGCAIISNSFVLAKEMLDGETGIIFQGDSVHELAEHAISLLGNRPLRRQMGQNAFIKTRDTTWKNVGQSHTRLFNAIMQAPCNRYGCLVTGSRLMNKKEFMQNENNTTSFKTGLF